MAAYDLSPDDLSFRELERLMDYLAAEDSPKVAAYAVRYDGLLADAAFGVHGSTDDSWKLVLFIRHLPQLTAEERMEMDRYNPKGPEDREEEQAEDNFLNGTPAKGTPEQKGTAPAKH